MIPAQAVGGGLNQPFPGAAIAQPAAAQAARPEQQVYDKAEVGHEQQRQHPGEGRSRRAALQNQPDRDQRNPEQPGQREESREVIG